MRRKECGRIKSGRVHRGLLALCICAGALSLAAGIVIGKKAENFCHSVTMRADEGGFDTDLLKEIMKNPDLEYTFAAWRENRNQQVAAVESGRADTVNVIEVFGPTHCILPYGKNLWPEDEDGCLIGVKLAEELFGSHQVEGQQIWYDNRILTVCGVIEEPEKLLLCETGELSGGMCFDRISVFVPDGAKQYTAGNEFISQYGLPAKLLRYDFYRDLSWLKEMIPGKWSDFDGWKENMEKKKQEIRLISGTDRSDVEAIYMSRAKTGHFFTFLGIGFWCMGGVLCFLGLDFFYIKY